MGASPSAGSPTNPWVAGAAAGVVAGVVTGVVIQFAFNPAVLAEGIPAAIGTRGVLAGWLVLLVLGVLLGVVYAAITRTDPLAGYAGQPNAGGFLGLAYGLVLWALAAILVPLWLGTPGLRVGEYAITAQGVLAYALFGVIIGIGHAVATARA